MKKEIITVKLPLSLNEKGLKGNLSQGIYYVGLLGKRPLEIPKDEKKTAKVTLCIESKEIIDLVLKDNDFDSRNEFIINALAWLGENKVFSFGKGDSK